MKKLFIGILLLLGMIFVGNGGNLINKEFDIFVVTAIDDGNPVPLPPTPNPPNPPVPEPPPS